ncbi:formyl transferase [Choanephora cucurbitarum]|nr:formyl transferase [Choanephora cucurbitarum]
MNQLSIFHTPPQVKTLNDWQIPSETEYDLGVVVSFGYFIPPHIIDRFKYGAINVHPSLLPKYRGAAPIQHAILYGDKETGVTIQELDPHEFDAGRILAQIKTPLDTPPVYSTLKPKLAEVGSRLLVDTLNHLKERKEHAVTQDITQATRAPKVQKTWSEMDFVNTSAWQAEQLNRAIGEQYPLRTIYQTHSKKSKDIVVQLLKLDIAQNPDKDLTGSAPGSFRFHEPSQSLHIVCGDQSVLACSQLKVQNKGAVSAKDFCNGYQSEGQFGVSLGVDDLIVERNMKKRAKMKPFNQ